MSALVDRKSSSNPIGKILPKSVRIGVGIDGKQIFLPTDVFKISGNAKISSLASGDIISMFGRGGTCAFAWSGTKGPFLMTCGHVLTGGGAAPSPNHIFNVNISGAIYRAQLAAITPISNTMNDGDAAIVKILDPINLQDFAIDHFGSKISNFSRMQVNKVYAYMADNKPYSCRSTHCVDAGASLTVDYGFGPVQFTNFVILEMLQGRWTRAGHSGALLGDRISGQIIARGMIFARNSYDPMQYPGGVAPPVGVEAPFAYAFHIKDINDIMHASAYY